MYNSGSSTNSARKYVGVVLVSILVTLAAITLFSSMRSVATGNIGVITQYGKVTGRELGEGFAWVAPWGVNNVTEYSVKTQKETQTATAATKDLQDATAEIVITYHLERGKVSEMHRTVGPNYKDVLIDPVAMSAFKANSARFDATELINERPQVESDVKDALVKKLGSRGITIEDVAITNLKYSDAFTQAIEQRQVAQQNAEKAKYNLQQAELDAQSQDVQAKTLTPEYLQLKAIEKWNGVMPQYVGGDGNVLSIPIK